MPVTSLPSSKQSLDCWANRNNKPHLKLTICYCHVISLNIYIYFVLNPVHYVQVFLSTASCHCKFYCFVLRHPYVLPVSLFLNGEMGISELLLVLTLEPIPPLPFLPLSSFSLPSSPLPFPLIPSLSSSSFPFPSLSSHSLSSLSLSLQVSWASSTKSMLQ